MSQLKILRTPLWPNLEPPNKNFLLLSFAPNVKGKWVDSNFRIIDLQVPPRAAGVAGTLMFVHIANFATLQPWLHVGSFTCRILIHCIRTRDPYFYVPLRKKFLLGTSCKTFFGGEKSPKQTIVTIKFNPRK